MPFRDLVGHRQLVELLARAVARDSLPPSLIFSGPEGVGKATAAVALAQVLNCEQVAKTPEGGVDACGACTACRRIARAAGAFRAGGDRPAIDCLQWLAPDDKASIKIDPVRDVLARAGYRPFDGRRRLVVIDEAQCLEVPAQQALLKMLEEPPSATRFVLVTAQADVLLPTIRSRCPQLRFAPLGSAEIADALVSRHGWSASDAQAAAALADGRLGRALGEDDVRVRRAREIAAEVLQHVATSRDPVRRLEAGLVLVARGESGRGKGESGKGRAATANRPELSARLDALSALLRDIGVLLTRAGDHRLVNADLAPQLSGLAAAFAGDRLVRAFTAVDRARTALERNASQKIVADWLVLNL